MQPVELWILGVPEEILLYLKGVVEYGTSLVQHDFPVIQYKMSLSLMNIDDLKIPSAVLPVCIQIPAAVYRNLAAAMDQKGQVHVIAVKILVI